MKDAMSSFGQVKKWEELATLANYKVSKLAKLCGVSVRQLERYFAASQKQSPHAWLHSVRMKRAVELLRDGTAVKETAIILRYKDSSHFIHDFKKHFGSPPKKSLIAACLGLPWLALSCLATENVAF